MKGIFLLSFVFLTPFCLHGQNQPSTIILTTQDVITNSVHLNTSPSNPAQNVVFRYVNKTSADIKVIADKHPRAKIMKDGVVVAETVDGGCGGYVDSSTNYVGLVLIFTNYDQAKLAKKALRGE